MLLALLGGDTLSAGELARIAGRSPSGATAHLRTLREAGLVVASTSGRQRLFRLASPGVAEALEALERIAPPRPITTLRESVAAQTLKRARTCYDHLAGELGVAVTDGLLNRGLLHSVEGAFRVTTSGTRWFASFGIDLDQLAQRQRSFARACLDWTERRPHLAGAVGASLADLFFTQGWVRRLPGGRAIAVSAKGRNWLEDNLEIRVD